MFAEEKTYSILPVLEGMGQMSTGVENSECTVVIATASDASHLGYSVTKDRFGNKTQVVVVGPVLAMVDRGMTLTRLREGV